MFDEFSKQTVEQVADYYKQARSAQAASEQWGVKAAAYFDRAMQPSDSLLWRLPILRDVRAGWIEGGGKYAQSVSDGFKAQANELEGAARDLETSTRWAKPVSKVVNVKTISVLDAAVTGGQWAEDTENHVGLQQKITDTVTTGVYHAAMAYGGGALGAAACTATGAGALLAGICAGIGSWIGGKVADYTDKYVDAAANWTVNAAEDAGHAIASGAGHAADWAKKHLCPWC